MLDKARGMEHAFPLPEATAPITLKHSIMLCFPTPSVSARYLLIHAV
jgi:hypothetical protein